MAERRPSAGSSALNQVDKNYKYGGDSAIGALLLPERREILQEEQNQFIGYDDRGQAIVQTLPAQYGESEVDFSYSPIVRGARATGSFLNDIFFGDANEQSEAAGRAVSAVRGVVGGLGDYASSQYEAGMAGGAIYDPETRQITEFDPALVMGGGSSGGGPALASGFRRSGSKISNQPKFIESPETNAFKSRETEIVMSPSEFLDLSDDLFERDVKLDSQSFIKNQIEKGEPLEAPFLNFDLDDRGVATVIGQEGRHRARVLEEMGIDEMPVRLRSQGRNEIRWSEQNDPNNRDRLNVPWPKLLLPQNNSSGSMIRFPVPDPLSKPLSSASDDVMLGDTLLYSGGGRQGTAIAGGSALRESFRIGDEGFDPRFDNRAKEQQRIADTELTYEGSPIVRPEVSIFDYEGKPFRITMADRTKAGSRITGVEGVDYDLPVELQGGQDFMFANPAGREGQVWAQDRGATSAFLNSFMGLDGKPIADEVLMLPYRMAPSGGDFSTMTGEVMVTHARNAVSKKAKRQADKTIKEFYPAWKGIDNPESIDQIREMTGDPRKSLLQVMDRDLRNEGGLGIGQARLAVTDRAQYNAPDFNLQNVGVANPYGDTRFEVSGHRTYGQGLAGRPEGILREQDINVFELMPDLVSARGFDSVDSLLRADPATLAKEQYTLRRGTRGGVITEDMLRDIEARRAQ